MTYLRVIAIGTICIVAGIGLAAGQTKKPPSSKTGASADTITRKQADTIINELRQIRRLLETDPVPVAPVATARRPPQQARMNVSPRWFAMGRDDAPVTIVEFTDLQCPFCRSFHTDAFAELKNRYIDTGKVRFVSRDLPLSSHPYAASAALAVRCAGEQGKFWEMRESLITHANDLAAESVTRYAGEVGLDRANFKQCVDSGKYKGEIEKDAAEAAALGISGTPSFVIAKSSNRELIGEQIFGAQPFAAFDAAIKKLLEPGPVVGPAGGAAPAQR